MKKDTCMILKKDFLVFYDQCLSDLVNGDIDSARSNLNNGYDACQRAIRGLNGVYSNVFVDQDVFDNVHKYAKVSGLKKCDLNNLDLSRDTRDKILSSVDIMTAWLKKISKFYTYLRDIIQNLSSKTNSQDFHIVYQKTVLDSMDDLVGVLPKKLNINQVDQINDNLKSVDLRPRVVHRNYYDGGIGGGTMD